MEYVELLSNGRIELDVNQGIEDDPSNNAAKVITTAYPDRPQIGGFSWLITRYLLPMVLLTPAYFRWNSENLFMDDFAGRSCGSPDPIGVDSDPLEMWLFQAK